MASLPSPRNPYPPKLGGFWKHHCLFGTFVKSSSLSVSNDAPFSLQHPGSRTGEIGEKKRENISLLQKSKI